MGAAPMQRAPPPQPSWPILHPPRPGTGLDRQQALDVEEAAVVRRLHDCPAGEVEIHPLFEDGGGVGGADGGERVGVDHGGDRELAGEGEGERPSGRIESEAGTDDNDMFGADQMLLYKDAPNSTTVFFTFGYDNEKAYCVSREAGDYDSYCDISEPSSGYWSRILYL